LIDEFGSISSLIHIILLAVAMFSLAFLTVLGNTIVIYALRTNRHLRTVIFMIFLSVYLNLLR
jgi:TRAP-type mannitol/chloroaromatic compound transport system permease large subunit